MGRDIVLCTLRILSFAMVFNSHKSSPQIINDKTSAEEYYFNKPKVNFVLGFVNDRRIYV